MAQIEYQGDDPLKPYTSNLQTYQAPTTTSGFGGFTKDNVFQSWDLNPLAQQTGVARDDLANQRDAFLQPLFDSYRKQANGPAAEDDTTLFGDSNFRAFVQSGQMPDLSGVSAAQRGTGGASRDGYNIPYPGFQFNDPYTKQLEDTARQQISNLSQPQQNPSLEQLLQFLNQRFTQLSQNPGYSPEEMALLRTQALDPIEQDRTASRQRALQRAAAAGYLPTSGITELTGSPTGGTETLDTAYDRIRAAAQRDLGINAINKRREDLQNAVSLGSLAGIQIPQGQRAEDQMRRSELLNLTQLLYNLPRQAQQDALAVINGSPSSNDVFNQALQQQQQARYQQQQDAERWAAIGSLIANMVF